MILEFWGTPKPTKGFSTTIARIPLSSVLPVTVTPELPPNRSIVALFVEPVLTFPLIVLLLTPRNEMLSGVGATSSLLVTAMLEEGADTNIEELVWPLNLLLSIVAWQRPKFVCMPFPEPFPGLLLFWIRLNCTNVILLQLESSSIPELLFWTMLFRILKPPLVPEKPGLDQIPARKQGSGAVEP